MVLHSSASSTHRSGRELRWIRFQKAWLYLPPVHPCHQKIHSKPFSVHLLKSQYVVESTIQLTTIVIWNNNRFSTMSHLWKCCQAILIGCTVPGRRDCQIPLLTRPVCGAHGATPGGTTQIWREPGYCKPTKTRPTFLKGRTSTALKTLPDKFY